MRGRKTTKQEGFERWEFWWEYNREPFLNIKENLAQKEQISGSADWLLGRKKKEDASASQRPTLNAIKKDLLPTLMEACDDSFFDVRAAAVIALGKAGDKEVLPKLVDMLADSNKQVSESAALAIGILGEPDGLPVLHELLFDTSKGKQFVKRPQEVPFRTRAFAAVGMGLIGDSAAVQDLLKIADPNRKEPNKDVPICAIIGLGIMGSAAKDAVGPLTDIASDPKVDDFIRSYAVTSLGKIGDPAALPLLRKALRDNSLPVMRSAVLSLGLLGTPEDAITVNLLKNEVRKGSDTQARNWACISLGKIGGAEAEKTLKEVVVSKTGSFQGFGALGLAVLAKKAGEPSLAGDYLMDGLRNVKDQSIQGAFAIALGIVQDKRAEAELVQLMVGDNSPSLRGYAAVALGMMRAKAAIPQIKEVVKERVKDPDLQRAAATSLGLMGDKDVVGILSEVIDSAKTEYVQSSAALALGFIGDYTAIETLTKMIKDTKGTADLARAQATVALGVVGEDKLLPVLHVISVDNNYRALVEAVQELLTIT